MRVLKNVCIFSVCLAIVVGYYTPELKEQEVVSYQTVVLKDAYNTLVPLEIPVYSSETTEVFEEIIQTMKSDEYVGQGLYPVLNEDVEIENISIEEQVVCLEVNNSFLATNNEEALDIAEALSYSLCGEGIEQIRVKVDGQEIHYIPNSTIPISAMNQELGINNFETDTSALFRTIPVLVYNEQTIVDQTYYIPTTLRVTCQIDDIDHQVQTILSKIDGSELYLPTPTYLQDGILEVHLGAEILQDSEIMNETLYLQVVNSLKSIAGVEEVSVFIDGQLQEIKENAYTSINNRIFF